MRHYSATTGLHAPPACRAPESTEGQTTVPVGGGRAWPGFGRRAQPSISHHAPLLWRAPEGPAGTGGLRDRPLQAIAKRVAISRAAGPEGAQNTSCATRNATHQAEPPTRNAARQAEPQATKHSGNHATQTRGSPPGRRAFTQLVHTLDTVERPSTQRSRAATTSATWTAFRAAPLRRLSPETTRTRPRLPSTAWS